MEALSGFEQIYATDLVYVPNCWQLCGDAHCCSFSRYKKNFKIIARTPFQELPLLPGEYEFLDSKGWLKQFGDYEHKIIKFPIEGYSLKIESIVSRKPNCPCEHNTRPTICRLYPLLPIFDIAGNLIGTESMGIYEEMERIAGLEPACQLTSLPFDQIDKFLAIIVELSKNPVHLYYLKAYRLAKEQVSKRLAARCSSSNRDVFTLFENGFIRRNLLDSERLRTELSKLASSFKDRYGDRFQLDKAPNTNR